jgi:hypothetical protein
MLFLTLMRCSNEGMELRIFAEELRGHVLVLVSFPEGADMFELLRGRRSGELFVLDLPRYTR